MELDNLTMESPWSVASGLMRHQYAVVLTNRTLAKSCSYLKMTLLYCLGKGCLKHPSGEIRPTLAYIPEVGIQFWLLLANMCRR
jgi:hypothetical protein